MRHIPLVVVFFLIAASGCTFLDIRAPATTPPNLPAYEDVNISSLQLERCLNPGDTECNAMPVSYSADSGLKGEGNAVITVTKNLYARIYVNDVESSLTIEEPMLLRVGDNRLHLSGFKLLSLQGSIIFRMCFSYNPNFEEGSQDSVCKQRSFPMPDISANVTPPSLQFEINRGEVKVLQVKQVKVTNTGKIPLSLSYLLPVYGIGNYSPNLPQYPFQGFFDYPTHYPNPQTGQNPSWVTLLPGESASFKVAADTLEEEKLKIEPGVYETKGYVYSLLDDPDLDVEKAMFRVEFPVTTEVK